MLHLKGREGGKEGEIVGDRYLPVRAAAQVRHQHELRGKNELSECEGEWGLNALECTRKWEETVACLKEGVSCGPRVSTRQREGGGVGLGWRTKWASGEDRPRDEHAGAGEKKKKEKRGKPGWQEKKLAREAYFGPSEFWRF